MSVLLKELKEEIQRAIWRGDLEIVQKEMVFGLNDQRISQGDVSLSNNPNKVEIIVKNYNAQDAYKRGFEMSSRINYG